MNKGLVIEFTDGTARDLPTANRTRIENGVLHVTCHRESFGFASWEEDIGSFPIVNVKSYRWVE